MDNTLPPYVQKFKYMLSDLNDHHNMHINRHEDQDTQYIQFKIWFRNLRTELRTNVNDEGDVLFGMVKMHIDDDANLSDVENILPSFAEITDLYDNNDRSSTVRIEVRSSREDGLIDGSVYIERVAELKSQILDADFVLTE